MLIAIRQAVRSALKDRAFVVGVALLLMLGGGGSISLASFLVSYIYSPFDFPTDGIVIAEGEIAGATRTGLSAGSAMALAESGAFSHAALISRGLPQLHGKEEPRQLQSAQVGEQFFEVFRLRPTVGDLASLRSNPRAVVVSYELWQTLGAPAGIVGSSLQLDDGFWDVVAVAPRGFNVPVGTDLWRPIRVDQTSLGARGAGPYSMYLRTSVPLAQARAAAAVVAKDQAVPQFFLRLERLADHVYAGFVSSKNLLLAAVGILIGVTLTNLYLLCAARARRIAMVNSIHVSLGAGPGTLVARSLAEVVTVVGLGGLAAAVVSSWLSQWLTTQAPAYLTDVRTAPLQANLPVYGAVTFAVAALVAALGFLAAVRFRSDRLFTAVHGISSRRLGMRLRLLVALQLAIAAAVMGTTLTLVRAYFRDAIVPDRVRSQGVLTFEIMPSFQRYRTPADRSALFTGVVDALSQVARVRGVGLTSHLPYGLLSPSPTKIARGDGARGEASALVIEVTNPFFRALQIDVRPAQGDLVVTGADAVITSSLAKTLYGSEDPVGRPLAIGRRTVRVSGVADDVDLGYRHKARGTIIVRNAAADAKSPFAKAVVGFDGASPADAIAAVKAAVRGVDAQQPITRLQTLDQAIDLRLGAPRFRMMIFVFAAILAIVVSAIGVLSMQNYYLGQRRQEFALRIALGASPGALVRYGLGSIAPSVAFACAAGGVMAAWVAKTMIGFGTLQASMLVDAACGISTMVAIAFLASAPAIRAIVRVSPRELLTTE